MITEIFLTFLVTSLVGMVLTLSKWAYRSKCKRCSFCGVEIERDTEAEEKVDELELQRTKSLANNSLDTAESKKDGI